MSYVAGSLLQPGTTVAGYRIESLIGRGGMGAVYRAAEEELGRKVAVKVIAPELAQDEHLRARFLRESRIAASLDHPHVIPIYGAGEEDGVLYLAMRYVEGKDLAHVLAEESALEPSRALDLLSQVAEALDAAHEKGLVHRDVKPSNVLIASSGGSEHCYLADFGLTKRMSSQSGVSAAGEIVGTLEYVAPEQITGDSLDERADVYSLGCVLYECLTGQAPFPRATDVALLWAHVHEEPIPPSRARPGLPKELDAVLARALAKEPVRRYRSAGELMAAACSDPGAHAARSPESISQGNLPRPASSFVGRERELAEIVALIRKGARLLTLTGPGGSGKTRLAIEAATSIAPSYPEGVFWVGLAALRDPTLVTETISQTLGARVALDEHIGERELLLLLDNLEHVIECAPELASLVGACPNLTLLVTSREVLHVQGEAEFAVPPLQEQEAVSLFSERAQAVEPDFAEEHLVLEICRRLDCLPLAVELAAARVKALSVEDLLQRLEKRLPLLTGGPRDAPERQRTLRATIAWSYELLTPYAQHLFADLAVFAGGCTLEAAEEICQTGVDVIAELVDKSLLRREGQRYFMLETIREFALECLTERGDLEGLRRRHAEYYLARTRSVGDLIRSPKAAALLDQLERDHDNLRAALTWLSGVTPDRALRIGMWGLAGRLHGFGDVALDRGNLVEAGRLYRESLEIGRQLEDDLQTAYSLAGLAAVCAELGRRDLAACLWGSVETFEQTSGTRLHEMERGRYERVLTELEQAPDTSSAFTHGKSMAFDETIEYVLANVD